MVKKVKSKSLESLFESVKGVILETAKKRAVQILMKKIFSGSTRFLGFKAWLVELGVNLFWDHIGEDVVQFLERKSLLVVDKIEGKILSKKLREAKEEGNAQEYDDAVDDILN